MKKIKKANPHTNSVSIIEINGDYGNSECGIDKEDILDVMGCKTRREIINLLREEPMFVSEISNELNIGQKAIIEHLRAMENVGILSSSYKRLLEVDLVNIMIWTMKLIFILPLIRTRLM